MTRGSYRRQDWLDPFDYHLATGESEPHDADTLSITLDFEAVDNLSNQYVQALGEILVLDEKNIQHVILRTTSKFDNASKQFIPDWDFLDVSGNALGSKTKRIQILNSFAQLMPLFYLSALRDAAREFQGRAMYWAPFLRATGIPEETREKLQEEIGALNAEVLKAHDSLKSLKSHLAKIQEVVAMSSTTKVDIDALPARISELLAKAQINITAATGASLPLTRHGSGTQSLAVIFLFEAFLATMLAEQYDELSHPILALEEPEAHLHPCAIRSLWTALAEIRGQKLIATHSGDLLASVPLHNVRRFCRQDGKATARWLSPGTLTSIEEQKVAFHLQSTRGELLFARCWLLGEGESEYWLFSETADILGYDLDRLGIRFVNTRLSGVEPLVKVANAFGINWCFVGDGDSQGKSDSEKCTALLAGRDGSKHIFLLTTQNIEVLLCTEGQFGSIFESNVSPQKKQNVTAQKGTKKYWEQVVAAQPNKDKITTIHSVIAEMKKAGQSSVPPILKEILKASVELAEAQS